jgi:PAS domain S-box-containing protein
MSISSKLKIAALVPGLVALVIGLALLFSYRVLDRARECGQKTKQLMSSMNELNSLAHYFILYHEDRPRRQFLSEHDSMTKLIASLRFQDKTQQELLDGIRHNSELVRKAFLRLVAAYERPAPAESYALSSEAEERLAGRVLTTSRDLVSHALRLEVLIDGEIATTQRRVSWLAIFILLGTGIPLTFILIRTMRGISASLAILRQGTEAVGAGRLEYRIGMAARDEIGDLSRAFDLMTERLSDTTVSRDRLRTEVEERKRAEEEVHRQGEWLRVTLKSIGDAVIATDIQGRVSFLNPVAVSLTGWQLEEARGQSIQSVFRIINEQTRRPAEDILSLVLRQGKAFNLANHTALIHRDGREISIEDSAAPIRDAEGNTAGVVIIFHDVTEKRRAQEKILEAGEKFRIVADFTYDWEHWRLPDNRFDYVSPSCERITGYSREAFMQDPGLYTRIIHPDDRERMIAHMREDLCQREPCELEFRIVRRDGRERWIIHSCQLVTDAQGQPMGRRASNRDITKRKEAEEALRKAHDELEIRVKERTSELADINEALQAEIIERERAEEIRKAERQRLYDVLEALPAYVVLLSPDYHVPFANRFFRERFGESHGLRCYEYLFDRKEPCEGCETYTVMKTHAPHHWEWSGPDGRTYDVSDFPFTDTDGSTLIMEMGIDITERKRAEEQLKAVSLYARSLIEASLDPLVTINRDGKIMDVNGATELVTGIAREQLIGTDFSDYFEEPEKAREGYERVFREGLVRDYPLAIRHISGRITEVLYNASIYRNETGEVKGVFAAARDITEVKRAEENLKSYMARLEQSNRELEDFAHVASHDLQEPLRKIQTFSDLLIGLHHDSLNDTVRDYLQRMNLAAERMHTLVMALLRYSRITSHLESYTVFNLREPVEDAMADLGALCEEAGGRVEVGKLPEVKADRDLIRQLFQNLIGNALKYRGERKPVVRIYANASDSGLFWDIQVEDNGIGFDEVYLDKIFKPFQRLHGRNSPYKGTGMGLAICRKIVDRHGGIITARSVPGKGSTFIVSLPKRE